jgi:hypothetical protein
MPKPIVVLINWTHMTPTEMASLAHNVSAKLTASATTFSTPTVTPAVLNTAANRLELAYANRKNGAAGKTEFQSANTALDGLLHTEAAYVNGVANGNTATIELAGFTATSNSHRSAVVPATPIVATITGNAAAVHLQIPPVPGADSYCWVIFTGDTGSASASETHISVSGAAIVIPDGTTRETLHNTFTAGTKITVQVLAQNTAGKSGFSSPVSFTVGS